MLCLSLWQPWASLLVHGHKRIETRSWRWRHPLPTILAIHAARKWDDDLKTICCTLPFYQCLAALGYTVNTMHRLPRGEVVGIVTVVACRPTEQLLTSGLSEQERAFGDYGAGRFGFLCHKPMALEKPIPLRGMQGVWNWDCPAGLERQYEALP